MQTSAAMPALSPAGWHPAGWRARCAPHVRLRRLRRVRRAFDELQARPRRLAGAAALSLVVWAGIWLYTWLLLEAMGYHWPVKAVVTGSALGSLANRQGRVIADHLAAGFVLGAWAVLILGLAAIIYLAKRDR